MKAVELFQSEWRTAVESTGLSPDSETVLKSQCEKLRGNKSYAPMLESLEENLYGKQFTIEATEFGAPLKIKANSQASKQERSIEADLLRFRPWRKGPFSFPDFHIDSEWRSEKKLDCLRAVLKHLKDKRILDLGGNNGFYLYKLLNEEPRWAMNWDPAWPALLQGIRLKHLLTKSESVIHLPFGFNELGAIQGKVDVLLLMGIVYHHRNPLEILDLCRQALAPGGKLIVESQAIDIPESMALFPQKKYAGAGGMWFVPSPSCLENWLRRSGFNHVREFHRHPLDTNIQRATQWCEHSSLEIGLDPNNSAKTVEGYPAPLRVFFEVKK